MGDLNQTASFEKRPSSQKRSSIIFASTETGQHSVKTGKVDRLIDHLLDPTEFSKFPY